jgi:hypothetical protein
MQKTESFTKIIFCRIIFKVSAWLPKRVVFKIGLMCMLSTCVDPCGLDPTAPDGQLAHPTMQKSGKIYLNEREMLQTKNIQTEVSTPPLSKQAHGDPKHLDWDT